MRFIKPTKKYGSYRCEEGYLWVKLCGDSQGIFPDEEPTRSTFYYKTA
jgi:hypothetical protein